MTDGGHTGPSGVQARQSFGGFSLGSLRLALPMSALREVMACTELADLPCPAACVIGGIGLRGVVVPVVDLRIALGRLAAPATDTSTVVLMVHRGKILGLLADSVTGVFELAPGRSRVDASNDAAAAIFSAGAIRADKDEVVSLLSPEALSRLHQVPMVDDPEPARQQVQTEDSSEAFVDRAVPMMLLRCGDMRLAVEAMLVHATLSDPRVEDSALSGGHCRGVIGHGGAMLPAIDLQSLCGLGRLDADRGLQAFIVSLPAGQLAFLISGVVDVVRTQPEDLQTVPAFALPRPRLFAGSLALPAGLAERTGSAASHYLVLSTLGLTACPEVVALAGLNTACEAGTAGRQAVAAAGQPGVGRRSMLTYLLNRSERASPLEQVTEILDYEPDSGMFPSDGPLLGFMVNRGRSIPVVCLARAAGEACDPPAAGASVLVVGSQGELIGFAVTALGTIDQAEWEPAVPDFTRGCYTEVRSSPGQSRALTLLGSGDSERMLAMLDLQVIAQSLQKGRGV